MSGSCFAGITIPIRTRPTARFNSAIGEVVIDCGQYLQVYLDDPNSIHELVTELLAAARSLQRIQPRTTTDGPAAGKAEQ